MTITITPADRLAPLALMMDPLHPDDLIRDITCRMSIHREVGRDGCCLESVECVLYLQDGVWHYELRSASVEYLTYALGAGSTAYDAYYKLGEAYRRLYNIRYSRMPA